MRWGNEAATRLSGISVDKVKVIVYSLCGLLASLAGIIEVARLSSGNRRQVLAMSWMLLRGGVGRYQSGRR
jgi:ribose transport system permease protein